MPKGSMIPAGCSLTINTRMKKDNQNMGARAEPYLTALEVAHLCRISTKSVYRWVELRAVPVYRAGSQLRFKQHEIEAYLARDAQKEAERQLWP